MIPTNVAITNKKSPNVAPSPVIKPAIDPDFNVLSRHNKFAGPIGTDNNNPVPKPDSKKLRICNIRIIQH
jgi:hypothetical protein